MMYCAIIIAQKENLLLNVTGNVNFGNQLATSHPFHEGILELDYIFLRNKKSCRHIYKLNGITFLRQ